jgi:hypothetical protein
MTSELKAAASRANGAKSRGPKSPETLQKSSQNSVTHGFTAKHTVVLGCENPEQFQKMLDYYTATYQPGSPVEEDLVAEMAAARWRTQRLRMIETALMDSEIKREPPETASQDPGYRVAFAFRRLVDESNAISLASRYESRLHRIHERSHRTLRELQQSRKEQNVALSPSPAAEPPTPAPVQPLSVPTAVDEALPSAAPTGASPPAPRPEPEAAHSAKKLRNEPEPSVFPRDRRRISIVGNRNFRSLDAKKLRRFRQTKAA